MYHGTLYVLIWLIYSDRFVGNINIPFMVLHAKDDPICPPIHMPHTDLLRNHNCLIVQTDIGGHCDFFTKIPGQRFKYRRVNIIIKHI